MDRQSVSPSRRTSGNGSSGARRLGQLPRRGARRRRGALRGLAALAGLAGPSAPVRTPTATPDCARSGVRTSSRPPRPPRVTAGRSRRPRAPGSRSRTDVTVRSGTRCSVSVSRQRASFGAASDPRVSPPCVRRYSPAPPSRETRESGRAAAWPLYMASWIGIASSGWTARTRSTASATRSHGAPAGTSRPARSSGARRRSRRDATPGRRGSPRSRPAGRRGWISAWVPPPTRTVTPVEVQPVARCTACSRSEATPAASGARGRLRAVHLSLRVLPRATPPPVRRPGGRRARA